ncbi:nitrite reductase, copper-containing [Marinihelvus fidelis]|uniref:Copper-containing nitrite reductase n=2 Tax=Marinihelvus fidelis TaxID=2613842 RepID=A0A5N0TD60_9GAMM|nr:nitrite reductase, copper-containing [Marinihelvus fidelis]
MMELKIKIALKFFLPVILIILVLTPAVADTDDLPVEQAVLTMAPQVPPPIDRDHPAKVIVSVDTTEQIGRLADGVEYVFWTFGGSVPGPFIRVRKGDLVEFHLNNRPDSKMPHNIDLHAVTGPGGGATSSFTAPGHTTQFSFTALNPGLYVYHCATAPVGMHIANGMYGLILVEPEGGYPEVDREFYIMQSEFYTKGDFGDEGLRPFDMEEALAENPDYVVFNGSVGALQGDNSIHAEVGETVRLYVGNGGPNLVSSFHVIGEIFDTVYVEGGSLVNHNVQSTLVPAGGSAIVDFKLEAPGDLHLVDHSIFRAFNKGALGTISVGGAADKVVYSGQQYEGIYLPEGQAEQVVSNVPASPVATSQEERMLFGQRVYERNCMACHQSQGQGLPGAFPPLAESDYLLDDTDRAIDVLLDGLAGEITVNGVTYNGVMPATRLTDEEVANVLTYVLNSWGNEGGVIEPADVAGHRAAN